MAKYWDSFLSYCICNQSRQREVKSSMYALNECGVLIFKGLSLSYNEQGWCGSQIPSCTTGKDLEKQWSIAVWEIHACQSFKFFGRVSRSHCDCSDHSLLHVHLYVFTTSSPSTLKVSQLNIFIVFTPHFKPSQCLWAPILQSLSLRLPVLLVLALPSRSLFTQYMESSLALTTNLSLPFPLAEAFSSLKSTQLPCLADNHYPFSPMVPTSPWFDDPLLGDLHLKPGKAFDIKK